MSDFPELQHALVDAARRRYGRAPRTWRLMRPVAAAAAVCAAAAAAIFVVARPANDERSAAPGASGALERYYPVFQRPAAADDALPLSGSALERFKIGPGGAELDVTKTRLAIEDGSQRLYLVGARMLGGEAVCAALFRDGKETSTVCGPIAEPYRLAATVPAGSGEPPTVIGASPHKIDALSVETELGGYGLGPITDNGVLIQTRSELPLYVVWGNGYGHELSVAPPLGTEDGRPWPARICPKPDPLPPDGAANAQRVARAMARSQYPESLSVAVGPVIAQRGLGAPCGSAVAARTLSVPVAMKINRSHRLDSARYGTILVGQVDGRMRPFTSLGR